MSRIWIACLGFLTATWAGSVAAQDFEAVELTTVKLTDNVAVIAGGGGNIGVLSGPEGVLLVDTQFAELEAKIRSAIGEISPGPVRFVVNTHWHFDHVGCNACFARDGAVIIGPEGTRELMASPQEFPMLGATSKAFSEDALPRISVSGTATLNLNGERVDLVPIPGAHSGHDLVVLMRDANVMHAGDLYWSRGYPYIGSPHGGDVDGLIEAAERMLSMCDEETRIIPGHGPVTGRAELEAYRDLLVRVRGAVADQIAAGRSEEEIVASGLTAETDDERRMGMPAELFIRLVYRDLTTGD